MCHWPPTNGSSEENAELTMESSFLVRQLPECPRQASGVMGNPQSAIASLVLAWVLLLSPSIQGATPEGPCEQQLRYRHSTLESASTWISTVALLSSICATWVFAFYALQCLCAKKDLCVKEAEAECETLWQANQECCTEVNPDASNACVAPQALACIQPKSSSRKPTSNHIQQAYAHQLVSMEEELESFLREVRGRRCALGEILQNEQCLANLKRDSDKLRITIYEIADSEGAGQVQQRG